MTLKEKFQEEPVVLYKDNFKLTNQSAELLVEIADEFAIGFAEWFAQQPKVKVKQEIGLFNCYMKITSKELLELYKKEKKL